MSSRSKKGLPIAQTNSVGETAPSNMTERELARMKKLQDDPYCTLLGPLFVECHQCKTRIKLSPKSTYDAFHWTKHKERCLRKSGISKSLKSAKGLKAAPKKAPKKLAVAAPRISAHVDTPPSTASSSQLTPSPPVTPGKGEVVSLPTPDIAMHSAEPLPRRNLKRKSESFVFGEPHFEFEEYLYRSRRTSAYRQEPMEWHKWNWNQLRQPVWVVSSYHDELEDDEADMGMEMETRDRLPLEATATSATKDNGGLYPTPVSDETSMSSPMTDPPDTPAEDARIVADSPPTKPAAVIEDSGSGRRDESTPTIVAAPVGSVIPKFGQTDFGSSVALSAPKPSAASSIGAFAAFSQGGLSAFGSSASASAGGKLKTTSPVCKPSVVRSVEGVAASTESGANALSGAVGPGTVSTSKKSVFAGGGSHASSGEKVLFDPYIDRAFRSLKEAAQAQPFGIMGSASPASTTAVASSSGQKVFIGAKRSVGGTRVTRSSTAVAARARDKMSSETWDSSDDGERGRGSSIVDPFRRRARSGQRPGQPERKKSAGAAHGTAQGHSLEATSPRMRNRTRSLR